MPGTMISTATELAALPITGAAWNRVVATSAADAGTPNLANIDSIVQSKVLVQALRWARDGGGVGRTAIINKIKAAPGTENATTQPLNPYRQIATWIAAADLVDMPGSTVCANGQTFDAWVASLPDKVLPGQTNWNTVRKTARVAGNNWGAYARPSLLAIGLWLDNTAIINEARAYYQRWAGDTSVANTFTPSNDAKPGWDGPNTVYPTSQGVINPVSSNAALNGANAEDAGRGSDAPPLAGSGASYTMEALDGALMTAILLWHHGDTDVWTWADSALKRNAVSVNANANLWSPANHIYWHETPLINHMYGISLPVTTSDSYGGRAVPYCTDWLVQGNWMKGSVGGGGGTTSTPPNVSATVSLSGLTVTVNATGTTAGSSAIAQHIVDYGDGTVDTWTEPQRTGSHTYAAGGTKTITVTAVDTAGATDVTQLSANVASDRAPIASFTLSPQVGPAPLLVTMNSAASNDPDGTAIVRAIDWGDGATTSAAGASASHTYTTPGTYTVRLDVTSNSLTTSSIGLVTVVDPAARVPVATWTVVGGVPTPVQSAYDSTWNGNHPIWGNYHVWVDATGDFRSKLGAPTSDLDGTVIGTQS